MHLGKVIQGPKEALRSFVNRFNLEALQIHDMNAGVAFDAFIRGLRPESFKFDLVKKKITTLAEALREAAVEVCVEDCYIKDQHELKAPAEMKTPYSNMDKSKYCHFHKDCGHETNECKHLKRALEDLAHKGKMNSYLPQGERKFQKRDDCQSKRKESESIDEDVVFFIYGGFAAEGPTNRGHKNYLRELSQIMLTNQAESDPFPKVVISELDRGKLRTPHDDFLVVEVKIANLWVRRILIDTGSSMDIISAYCLSRLKLNENDLVPIHHPIIGFGGGVIHPMGTVTLPLG
ncbi:uncharacterized protein LOC125497707 [Beta vulgaris subsp. vulgaris]|uniref:uncharacterized protein LOC125497707 n=1 Tax=Beta vulgaris subsp. vulgaris TaxID=3555 RepID=UPI002036A810|nr:uncharacterized protein LOC125497707 [Beta vulgaris subsp. vulgaris]